MPQFSVHADQSKANSLVYTIFDGHFAGMLAQLPVSNFEIYESLLQS